MGYALAALITVGVLLTLTLVPLLVAQVVLIARRGHTIGMRMAGLRVVRIDGTQAGFWRGVFLRSLPLVAAPVLACGLVESVWYLALAIVDRQTLMANWNTYEAIKMLKLEAVVGVAIVMLFADAAGSFQRDGRALRDRCAGTVVTCMH